MWAKTLKDVETRSITQVSVSVVEYQAARSSTCVKKHRLPGTSLLKFMLVA